MKIGELLAQKELEKTVLIGFYGGGNYGDELLLEVLSNLFQKRGLRDVSISYQKPENASRFHHSFGYAYIPLANKFQLLKTIIIKRNIIIGGGGLWGMDVNSNIFFLSLLLFISRWFLGKKIYLIGVGYYNSTSKMGHLSAFLAAKAANTIVSRDKEAYANFSKFNKHVSLDTDIAWYIKELDLDSYLPDLQALKQQLVIKEDTLFVSLRRFEKNNKNNYAHAVEEAIKKIAMPTIVAIMEPRTVDPEGWDLISKWQQENSNLQIIDFSYNPLALYLLFKESGSHLKVISPQFHVIITAYLTNVAFFPLAYDNKVTELLKLIAPDKKIATIKEIDAHKLKDFIADV